ADSCVLHSFPTRRSSDLGVYARVGSPKATSFRLIVRSDLWQTTVVRAGLRPQIVLLLALVMAVSFVPLYFAVATYTKTAQTIAQREQAVELTRTIATAIEKLSIRGPEDLSHLLGGRVVALRRLTAAESVEAGAALPPSGLTLDALTHGRAPSLLGTTNGTWVGLALRPDETL